MSDTPEHRGASEEGQSEPQRSWLSVCRSSLANASLMVLQDARRRLGQLRAQDYALWAAAALLLGMLPIFLVDGSERSSEPPQSAEDRIHEALLNTDQTPQQQRGSRGSDLRRSTQNAEANDERDTNSATTLEAQDPLQAQTEEAQKSEMSIVWASLSKREQQSRFESYLNDLSQTPEGQILADAMRKYHGLDSEAAEELLDAFNYRVLSTYDPEIEDLIASWEFGQLLRDRNLYVSILPAELVPRLVALEQAYYRAYAEVDPVDCGRLPLLVHTSTHDFPTMSLRVSAQELDLLKSRQSIFALENPALRKAPDQRHHSAILERAASGRNTVLETVEDLAALPYEDALRYECHLALTALDYIAELDGSEQVSLYEDLFGTRFQYVNTETHSDFLLPEQVRLFSSLSSEN